MRGVPAGDMDPVVWVSNGEAYLVCVCNGRCGDVYRDDEPCGQYLRKQMDRLIKDSVDAGWHFGYCPACVEKLRRK